MVRRTVRLESEQQAQLPALSRPRLRRLCRGAPSLVAPELGDKPEAPWGLLHSHHTGTAIQKNRVGPHLFLI